MTRFASASTWLVLSCAAATLAACSHHASGDPTTGAGAASDPGASGAGAGGGGGGGNGAQGDDDGTTASGDDAGGSNLDGGGGDLEAGDGPGAPDVVDAGPPIDCTQLGSGGEPLALGCTGLYSDWATRTIAADARPYDPALHLWSDGAEKARFIRLPPGTKIDTSNMDEWTFPVGTKLWKEFRINGLAVETRMIWKTGASTWVRATYAWSQDQSTAQELTTGATNVWGTTYEIPKQSDCPTCHQGRLDGVLGFEAIGLSHPNATGLTMNALVSEGLVTNAPASPLVIPGDATASAALGWLHANCGTACHNGSNYALANDTGLHMRLDVAKLGTVQATDTWTTAVNVVSSFQPNGPGSGFYRIKPRDVAHSCIPYRDGRRDDQQMPPLATHVVDTAGVALVSNWINAM